MIHYFTGSGIANPWVAYELRMLKKNDIPFILNVMRKPKSTFFRAKWALELHDQATEIYPMNYVGAFLSVLLAPFIFKKRFFEAFLNSIFGKREHLRARVACIYHFFVACHWARLHNNKPINHIHSQWAHACCSIAMYVGWLLDKPFSFTGHGADLWRDRVALEDKVRRADFIACISKFHRDLYLKLGAEPEKLHIVYCGIDMKQFYPRSEDDIPNDGTIHIRSSGRLVEKKGFKYLIEACRILEDHMISFDCIIAGSGPMEAELREMIDQYKLNEKVTITGEALKQEDIASFAHGGTVYCLACVWASDNDADGLPQMLMENMACGIPVISTRLVGIPDLVIDEKTGLLVEPNNAAQLADAIERLGKDKELSKKLAEQGRLHVKQYFELEKAVQPIIKVYKKKLFK